MRKLFGGVLSLVLIGAALLLPTLAYFAHDAYGKLAYLERQRYLLKKDVSRIIPRQRQIRVAKNYVDETSRFTQSAHTVGLTPEAWDMHKVSFKKRIVPFRELGWLSANTRPGANYYFVTQSLEIFTPDAGDWQVRELSDQSVDNLDHVLVTMEGEYWVRDPLFGQPHKRDGQGKVL
ncbi:MAG: hypothetical protein HQL72_11910 [Magnetococcales bacterium]|nr:hypothetical protein [Magnetococcales bacterium]